MVQEIPFTLIEPTGFFAAVCGFTAGSEVFAVRQRLTVELGHV